MAAAILNLSQIARGRTALDLIDFRIALLAIGAIGLVASFRFLVCRRPPAPRFPAIRRGIEIEFPRPVADMNSVCVLSS